MGSEIVRFLLPAAALGVLCGAWVLVQRFVSRRDPGQPGVENRCGSCGGGGGRKHRHSH